MSLNKIINQHSLTQQTRESVVAHMRFICIYICRVNRFLLRFPINSRGHLKIWLQMPPYSWLVAPVSKTQQVQVAPLASKRGVSSGFQYRGFNDEL